MENKKIRKKEYLFISPFYKSRYKNGGFNRSSQLVEIFSEYDFLFYNPYFNIKDSLLFLKKNFLNLFISFIFATRLYLFKGLSFKGFLLIIVKSIFFIEIINKNRNRKILMDGAGNLPIIFCQYLIQRKISFMITPANIEYLVRDPINDIYFRSNFYKYKNEIEVYNYSEKVITISEYDSSILACHNIFSKCFPYFPNTKHQQKLFQISKYRQRNIKKIVKNGHILILGSMTNNPTKLGILKLLNKLNKIPNLECHIKIAGFGTEGLIEIENNKIDILGSVSEKVLEGLMQNCKCLIINQAQTTGFLTKIVEFNLARIPILVTSNYYQAKNLEKYGVFYKDTNYLSNHLLNRILNKKYKLFEKPKRENKIFSFIYN